MARFILELQCKNPSSDGEIMVAIISQVHIFIPLFRNMRDVRAYLSALRINARGISGALFNISSTGYDVLTDQNLTVSVTQDINTLTVCIEAPSLPVSTGDTPISVEVVNCVIAFTY